MALQQDVAVSTAPRIAVSPWVQFAAGSLLCAAIAAVAIMAANYAPIVGAPVIAIAIGVVITNTLSGPLHIGKLRIGEISKLCLKGGIVLLGASLDLGVILRTGIEIAPGAAADHRGRACVRDAARPHNECALAHAMPDRDRHDDLRRVGDRGVGTGCASQGGRDRLCDIGHLLLQYAGCVHVSDDWPPDVLSDPGFGLWAGTAVNDTSAVVAAGFAYSHDAGTIATIVKLTRTTLIIPLVVGFGLLMPWFEAPPAADSDSLGRTCLSGGADVHRAVRGRVAAEHPRVCGAVRTDVQLVGRWVLVVALAAVGLQGHWRAFAGAGTRPLLLGLATWVTVALASLAVQAWTNSL